MKNKNSVIVVHPGTQRSYYTALAIQKIGLLKNFYTSIYYKPGKFPFFIFERLPFGLGKKIIDQFKRRYLPELDIQKIITYPLGEIIYLVCTKIPFLRKYSSKAILWRNKRFYNIVARKISKQNCKAVICYDSAALNVFKKAKKEKITCILDQTIAHYKTGKKILEEEAKLHPEFADTLIPPSLRLIEQLEKEIELADYILAGSEFTKKSLIENGVSHLKIKVIPYGVDIERFAPLLQRKSANVFRILFVGGIGQRKGIKYLLEVYNQLKLPNAELILVGYIIGSGKGLEPYKDIFTYIPHVSHHQVHKSYQKGHIFVFPSLLEGFCKTTIEAMASGLPVITTPNAGVSEVIRDGIDGFMVPIRDIEALKEKILLLYENRKLCEEMGQNARERAKEFTWDKYQERIGKFLKSILEIEIVL